MRYLPGEHWVCFSCRKQFRKPSRQNCGPWELPSRRKPGRTYVCPECKAPMINMGMYFKPPRREDKQGWKRMQRLAENGVRFVADDTVAFIYLVGGTRPKKRHIEQIIEGNRLYSLTRGQELLLKIARKQPKQSPSYLSHHAIALNSGPLEVRNRATLKKGL